MAERGSRVIMGYHFEDGSLVVNLTGDVDTEDALAMLETLIGIKRRELQRFQSDPVSNEELPDA